jgi:hypothetical protein
MGWDRGRYYTRSRKVNGRVVREYVGGGLLGVLAAADDALAREERARQAEAWLRERAEDAALDGDLNRLEEITDLLAQAALVAGGFHEHRGEWRKRRVTPTEGGAAG